MRARCSSVRKSIRCFAASIPGASSSRFSSSSAARFLKSSASPVGSWAVGPALPRPGEKILAAARFAPEFVLLRLQAHDLGTQRPGLFHQPFVGFAAAAELFGVLVGVNEIADEIEQQFLEYLEAVRVMDEIPEQHVILEKKRLVGPAFEK